MIEKVLHRQDSQNSSNSKINDNYFEETKGGPNDDGNFNNYDSQGSQGTDEQDSQTAIDSLDNMLQQVT
jgi:hypothetical protein